MWIASIIWRTWRRTAELLAAPDLVRRQDALIHDEFKRAVRWRESCADDLRTGDWRVNAHYDLDGPDGERRTHWSLSHPDGRCLHGDGRSDAEALNRCRAILAGNEKEEIGVSN